MLGLMSTTLRLLATTPLAASFHACGLIARAKTRLVLHMRFEAAY